MNGQAKSARRLGLVLVVSALAACQGIAGDSLSTQPRSGQQGGGLMAPARATFQPVDDVLQGSCGTLDCHGQVGRSLRLYGGRGLRLSPQGNSADDPTTPEEYDQSYFAVIGLEPEIMSDVVADHGRMPERLTLVRKARNLEHHKGGMLFAAGDDRDRCLTSWLAGELDTAACLRGKEPARPKP
jgi:hypothetical protein